MKIIYILGWGHSGSTLLDLLIGSSPEATSVGEFIFMNFYARQIKHYKVLRPFDCTCGESFSDCDFWNPVDQEVGLSRKNVVYDDAGNMARLQWLAKYLAFRLSGGRYRPSAASLGDDEEIFHAALQKAPPGTRYLCDSSKDFARFARLLMMPGIEVHPIFMVRDVRAVANSYTRKKRVDLGLNKMSSFGAALRWLFINSICRVLLAVSGRPFVHISYDELCADPGGAIDKLNSQLGLSIEQDTYLENINGTTYHNVGGNLVRFKTIRAIAVDDSWKTSGNGFSRLLIGLLFWPFNRLWVHRRARR